jgi:quercetin dioxygenase-like cupin family protein
MVSAHMGRVLVGMAAVAADLGWLQLSPAFGFPVTAPAGMLDRLFGADREAGLVGWALLLLAEAVIVGFYFLVVEPRVAGPLAPTAFAISSWLLAGAVLMPLIGLLQGAPAATAAPNDPMRANLFMLNLGPGAAAAALVGWLLLGAVLGAGRSLDVGVRAFAFAVGAAVLAAAIALFAPAWVGPAGPGSVAEGRVALPASPVFISVLELPQPPGAVLGPHQHVAGFVVGVSGTETVAFAGGDTIEVGPGEALFTENNVLHGHENRAAIPLAIGLAFIVVGLAVVLVLGRGRGVAIPALVVLLVAGTVGTVNPLMNHWYFVAVRPVAARGAAMPVPAGHRTYESETLTGISSGPSLQRLTDRGLISGDSVRLLGPAAIIVLEGAASIAADGREMRLSAQSGATIPGGAEAKVESTSGSTRVLLVQVLPAQ